MSQAAAEHVVKSLVQQFNRNFPPDGMKQIWKELCALPDKALLQAGDHICLNHTFLPSPAQLLDKAKTQAKLIATAEAREREDEWNRTKGGASRQDLQKTGSIFTREQQTEMGRKAMMMIHGMIGGKIGRGDFLEGFKAMESLYPGIGWAKQGMRLKGFWEEGKPAHYPGD